MILEDDGARLDAIHVAGNMGGGDDHVPVAEADAMADVDGA
jgi:hypothetical protein